MVRYNDNTTIKLPDNKKEKKQNKVLTFLSALIALFFSGC